MKITFNDASRSEFDAISAGLRAFNREQCAAFEPESFCAYVRDDAGKVVGGVLCELSEGQLYVGVCWVEERHRRKGYGRKAMLEAEREAARRGCSLSFLDTFEFQARPFYERLGYRTIGSYTHPVGVERYFMIKELAGSDDDE